MGLSKSGVALGVTSTQTAGDRAERWLFFCQGEQESGRASREARGPYNEALSFLSLLWVSPGESQPLPRRKGGMLESHAVPVSVWISSKGFRFQRLLWKMVPGNYREGNVTMVPRNCTAWGRVEIKEAIQKLEKGIGLWDPETAERGGWWARDEGQRGCVSNQQPLQQQTPVRIQIQFCGVSGRGL